MNMLIKNNKNEESNVKALDHEAWEHAWKFLDKLIHIFKMIKEQQKIIWFYLFYWNLYLLTDSIQLNCKALTEWNSIL